MDYTLDEFKSTDWYKERPDIIKQAIEKTPPIRFYRFKDSKKECYIVGYTEPEPDDKDQRVTLIVQKTGKGGPMDEMGLGELDTNQVFGVDPDNLEPAPES